MENNTTELLVTAGPLEGQRFTVTASGIRLGRSSSCEISMSDPMLSRNQCLFELREGTVYVTDLASANGTMVNGENLGSSSCPLKTGDRVQAGDSELALVAAGADADDGAEEDFQNVDLGFSQSAEADAAESNGQPTGGSPMRLVLWLVLVLVLGGSAAAILFVPRDTSGGAAIARPLSWASRSFISRKTSSYVTSKPFPCSSSVLRLARASGDAVIKILTGASGKITVPMSRPSMTT